MRRSSAETQRDGERGLACGGAFLKPVWTPAPRLADDIRPRYRIAAAKELPATCSGVSASDNAPLCQRQGARRRLSTCREAIEKQPAGGLRRSSATQRTGALLF